MWLLVIFDIPVKTKKQQKLATKFRKELLGSGFIMLQYSVYSKPIPSVQHRAPYVQAIKSALPEEADVKIFSLTDKQYAEVICLIGTKQIEPKKPEIKQPSFFDEF